MLSSKLNWLLAIVIIATSCIDFNAAELHCYDFEFGYDGWINNGSKLWLWSVTDTPAFIPDYFPTSHAGYLWFQDQVSPPNTATIVTNYTHYNIYPEDKVSIDIYRHIENFDGSYRPVLNFVADGHKQNIIWSFDVDDWYTVSILCGPEEEPCCIDFPCNGYFSVDGSIMARNELLAVDNIQVNDGCTLDPPTPHTLPPTPPPTLPPTPSPSSWCCTFEVDTLCDWSLEYQSNGWHWSGFLAPSFYTVPPYTGNYIYEENLGADVFTQDLIDVPYNAQFAIDYYFQTVNYDPINNNLQFYYQFNSVTPPISLLVVDTNTVGWTSVVLTPPTNLCGATLCQGTFHVKSSNTPGNEEIAAVDNFRVYGATCYP